MKEREVKIIIHGDMVIKQMGEAEKVAFMAALLARMLETTNKHERGRDHPKSRLGGNGAEHDAHAAE